VVKCLLRSVGKFHHVWLKLDAKLCLVSRRLLYFLRNFFLIWIYHDLSENRVSKNMNHGFSKIMFPIRHDFLVPHFQINILRLISWRLHQPSPRVGFSISKKPWPLGSTGPFFFSWESHGKVSDQIQHFPTMWGPRWIAKLVQITPITMVYR